VENQIGFRKEGGFGVRRERGKKRSLKIRKGERKSKRERKNRSFFVGEGQNSRPHN
jgi:hypothetical protein